MTDTEQVIVMGDQNGIRGMSQGGELPIIRIGNIAKVLRTGFTFKVVGGSKLL